MTPEELIKEIMQLPLERRIELLETISRSVREEIRPREQSGSIVRRLRGIASFEGASPTDRSDQRRLHTLLNRKILLMRVL
jgi:hypothetical protein